MLDAFKRMLSRDRSGLQWSEIEAWSRERGFGFRRSRDDAGFVVDGMLDGRAWRLEWGPPQRHYIVGPELRLRMELGLPQSLQLLVLSRPLMLALERETFERFTDGTQTKIDTTTPEEMRWLAMFPQYSFGAAITLRALIGAVGSSRTALARWLEGPLAEHFEVAGAGVLAYPTPFVLMSVRGRLSLRIGVPAIDTLGISQALALFAVAVQRILAIADSQGAASSGWPTTGASATLRGPLSDDPPDSLR